MPVKNLLLFFFCTILLLLSVKSVNAATFYVATDGSDSNPGTITKPLKNIQTGIDKAISAGDTLYVRAGTYHETLKVLSSGNPSSPITISGYPGERPIIDGSNYTLPAGAPTGWCDPKPPKYCLTWKPFVEIVGNYVIFSDFEITKTWGKGIQVKGDYDTVKNNWVHDLRNSGIYTGGTNTLIINNKVWFACNYAQYDRAADNVNWPGGISTELAHNITIKGNEVFNVWGEGILPMYSPNTVVEDNVVYDNFAANIYLCGVNGAVVQRNLVYSTNTPPFLRFGDPTRGLLIADENRYTGNSHNIKVINNIFIGHAYNLSYWQSSGGMSNTIIANNTFINAVSNNSMAASISIQDSSLHKNVQFRNNVIVQNTKGIVARVSRSGIIYSNNLWSKTPESDAQGAGDIIADPKLVNVNANLVPGLVKANWFKLTSGSPAINKAITLTEITEDYFKNSRGSNADIGAHEYKQAKPTLFPTATLIPTPIQGDANEDKKVDDLDYGIWLNYYHRATHNGSLNGDFNENGFVDGIDYTIWLNHYEL